LHTGLRASCCLWLSDSRFVRHGRFLRAWRSLKSRLSLLSFLPGLTLFALFAFSTDKIGEKTLKNSTMLIEVRSRQIYDFWNGSNSNQTLQTEIWLFLAYGQPIVRLPLRHHV
jgi:hypothetical protein